MDEQFKIISFNCEGAIRNKNTIKYIIEKNQPDILCMQESWVLNMKLTEIQEIDSSYDVKGEQGVDINKALLPGRPSGGLIVMYKKAIANDIHVIQTHNRRVYAVKIDCINGESAVVVNVYMPCDRFDVHTVNSEFSDALDEVESVIDSCPVNRVILCGDWNTSFERDTAQVKFLKQFVARKKLCITWDHPNACKGDTYINDSLGHRSCIDHFIVSQNVFNLIEKMYVMSYGINLSKHEFVFLTLKNFRSNTAAPRLPICNNDVLKRVAWHRCTDNDVELYKSYLDNLLSILKVPHEALECKDIFCDKAEHRTMLNQLCQDMVSSCIEASNNALPHSQSNSHTLPFWNETVEPYKEKSLLWHWIWIDCGRPREGLVANIMRSTRARYHLAVRQLKKDENDLRRMKMGEAISGNKQRNLWDEVKRMVPCGKIVATQVDDASDPEAIANVFANKFEDLYQSVPTDADELNDISSMIKEHIVNEDSIVQCDFSVDDIDKAIKKLNRGKSDGDIGLYSDHIIMCTYRFKVLLTKFINAMLVHGYNADNLLASVIASIPKCMRSSLSNSDNYRGIALCSALCKVIDYVFIDRYSSQLQSSNLQFAFKDGHDTVVCTAVLKETISYFNNRGSNVYACLLDASKAFDKVHFGKLFKLLFAKKIFTR